jgi:hypothetical protein
MNAQALYSTKKCVRGVHYVSAAAATAAAAVISCEFSIVDAVCTRLCYVYCFAVTICTLLN